MGWVDKYRLSFSQQTEKFIGFIKILDYYKGRRSIHQSYDWRRDSFSVLLFSCFSGSTAQQFRNTDACWSHMADLKSQLDVRGHVMSGSYLTCLISKQHWFGRHLEELSWKSWVTRMSQSYGGWFLVFLHMIHQVCTPLSSLFLPQIHITGLETDAFHLWECEMN